MGMGASWQLATTRVINCIAAIHRKVAAGGWSRFETRTRARAGMTRILKALLPGPRKPGAMAAVQITEGTIELTITDGKVTGATASGKGRWPIATGSAAAFSGKTFSWTSKTTGFNQYSVEVTAQ